MSTNMQKRIAAFLATFALVAAALVGGGSSASAAVRKMHGVPAGPGMFSVQTTDYYYAGIRQATTPANVDGFAINMTVHGPVTTNGCPDHSLGEISVQLDGSRKGVVEVGYLGGSCGSTTAPQLFVSRWTNSVWGGQYFGVGDGFVKCTAITCSSGVPVIAAGDTMTNGSAHRVLIQHSGGAWWVWANTTNSGTCTGSSCWVGYYDDSLWSGASPAVTFTGIGLVQAFGEVTNDDATDGQPGVCSNMGTKTGSGVSGNPSLGPPVVGASMGSPQFYGSSIPTVDLSSYVITNSAWYNMLPILSGTRTVAMAYGGGGGC